MSPFYELRIYECLPGRLPDMNRRMKYVLPRILRKHGLKIPVACWDLAAGGHLAALAYVLPFDDLDTRLENFGSLYADPEWHEARLKGNAGRPMVSSVTSYVLSPLDVAPDREPHGPEQRAVFYRLSDTKPDAAIDELVTTRIPARRREGARIIAALLVSYGPDMPAAVVFESRARDTVSGTDQDTAHVAVSRVLPLIPSAYCAPRPGFAEHDWPALLPVEN